MLRTRSGLPKHCGWNTDQHGRRRVRFRKAGFTTYLTGTPWSETFMRQYAVALDGVKAIASETGKDRVISIRFQVRPLKTMPVRRSGRGETSSKTSVKPMGICRCFVPMQAVGLCC